MAALRVVDASAEGSAHRDAFHSLATEAYGGQPAGTSPARDGVDRGIARPEFADRQAVLVALDGDVPVARLVARDSPQLRDERGRPMGSLGFFEALDRQDAADAVFRAGTEWLRARGIARIVGPMDGDTWHRYRVNVGPFERPPFPLEPWNPPYYRTLWETAGFQPLESYSSKWIDDVGRLLPGLAAGVERSSSRGVRIRGLDPARLEAELSVVHEISSEIFREALLYTPISREEFLAMYRGVERMLDPDLVVFATAPDGREVGFVFAYADAAQRAVHYKTIGVLAEWRRAAVAAALSHHVYSKALAKGLPAGNHALMRDDNRSQALDQGRGDVFRRYVLYEWPA
jgi:GNAT superfamily N-acetyltransferase